MLITWSGSSKMRVSQLLEQVEAAGLELQIEAGKLVVKGPRSAMTPELAEGIRTHKAALLALLQAQTGTTRSNNLLSIINDAEEAAIALAYEKKSTIADGRPPLEAVIALQEWLSTIDWSKGLRCGKTEKQCLICKGLPCNGSQEWES